LRLFNGGQTLAATDRAGLRSYVYIPNYRTCQRGLKLP
jgi:hypothetical protein